MKHNENNIEEQSTELFKRVEVNYSKSKSDVWASLSKQIESKPEAKIVKFSFAKISIAASVAAILSIGLFLRLYSTEIISKKGTHLNYTLPDGSTIEMNAGSKMTFHPYWWRFTRELSFEGEAYFEVEKGSNFSVLSEQGTTQVLGTSFNISTKNNKYIVYCKTGKVRVSSNKKDDKVILTPNMLAELNKTFSVSEKIESSNILGWINNEFKFSSTPLQQVLKELELQYDIEVKSDLKSINKITYTGFFKKQQKPESTLNLICSTFDFTFEKYNERVFKIVKKK